MNPWVQIPIVALLDLLAPPRCVSCDTTFEIATPFCKRCLEHIEPAPLLPDSTNQAAFLFGGTLQEAIHAMKYKQDDRVAEALAFLFGDCCPRPEGRVDAVVFVPLGRKRLRQRGFDQAAVLARGLARALGLPCWHSALTRTRETAPLSRENREERKALIQGVFSARPTVQGRSLVLVDDVLTTGATTGEASEALYSAGASKVQVRCLARTPKYNDW